MVSEPASSTKNTSSLKPPPPLTIDQTPTIGAIIFSRRHVGISIVIDLKWLHLSLSLLLS
jgi:hypothetical protein